MTIDDNIPCAACGYNLRGLPPAGNCPECGAAVAPSLAAPPLPAGRCAAAAALMFVAAVACLASRWWFGIILYADPPPWAWPIWLVVAAAVLAYGSSCAAMRLTAAVAAQQGRRRRAVVLKICAYLALLLPLTAAAHATVRVSDLDPFRVDYLFLWASAAAILCGTTLFYLGMASALRRLPETGGRRLARLAAVLAWLLPACWLAEAAVWASEQELEDLLS